MKSTRAKVGVLRGDEVHREQLGHDLPALLPVDVFALGAGEDENMDLRVAGNIATGMDSASEAFDPVSLA